MPVSRLLELLMLSAISSVTFGDTPSADRLFRSDLLLPKRKIVKIPTQNVTFKKQYDLKIPDGQAGRSTISIKDKKLFIGSILEIDVKFTSRSSEYKFYNPFFKSRLKEPARIALFDSRKQFVGDLTTDLFPFFGHGYKLLEPSSDWVSVPFGGTVGTTLTVQVPPGNMREHIKPGIYYVQLIYYRAFASDLPTKKIPIEGVTVWKIPQKPAWGPPLMLKKNDLKMYYWDWEFDYAELFRSNIVKIEFVQPEDPRKPLIARARKPQKSKLGSVQLVPVK
ncbi:MAG: hypothetical protein Tsb009_37860 [Planctomycetaceae bacterium]